MTQIDCSELGVGAPRLASQNDVRATEPKSGGLGFLFNSDDPADEAAFLLALLETMTLDEKMEAKAQGIICDLLVEVSDKRLSSDEAIQVLRRYEVLRRKR